MGQLMTIRQEKKVPSACRLPGLPGALQALRGQPGRLLKKPHAAQYGVKNQLKMLM